MSDNPSTFRYSIPREFIADCLSRIDIVEIIDKRVKLRKAGANYVARCPFHDEKTPSFSVSPSKQFYHCFGCGVSGDAIKFLMQYDHLSFVDAVKYLAANLGLELPAQVLDRDAKERAEKNKGSFDLLANVISVFQAELDKSVRAREYLKQRGLTREICQRFSIGYSPSVSGLLFRSLKLDQIGTDLLLSNGLLKKSDSGEIYERFRDRIIFPIRDDRGRCIAFGGRTMGDDLPKYLNSPETPIFHKGDELYGLFEAKEAQRKFGNILVVEGYMDVVALAQFGFNNAVASMGTAITIKQIEKLLRYSKEIVFSFDGDRAGRGAAWRALEIILPIMRDGMNIRFLFFPEKEDPDSFVRKRGPQAFSQLLEQSIVLSDFLFNHLQGEFELTNFEGRAAFAKKAGGLIKQVEDGVYQELLWQQLARLVRIDVEKLRKEGFKIQGQTLDSKLPFAGHIEMMPKAIETAISLLLHHPPLAREINNTNDIKQLSIPYVDLLVWVIQVIQEYGDGRVMVSDVIDKCQSPDVTNILAKLSMQVPIIPEQGLKSEFLGAIKMLNDQDIRQKIDKLLHKANTLGLTDEERKLLQDLIMQKT